jgi:tetratricopeptide (TPR) repeat protein
MKNPRHVLPVLLLLAVVVAQVAATQQQSGAAEDLFRIAVNLYREGKLDQALTPTLKAIELSPKDYRPRALAGYIYTLQRKYKSASEAFSEAIRLNPQQRELYFAKAQADRFRNAHVEALAAVRKATEIDPNYAEAWALLGEFLGFSKEQREEGIAALRTAIRLNPKLVGPYETLGNVLAYAKDEKGAEEAFRQGMAADPKRMSGRFALGRLLVKQGRLAEARKLWDERTSDQDNTFPNFIEELKRAENLKHATEELAKKPDDPKALVEMGLAVMEGDHWVVDGRQKRALVYFQKALELKPGYARAQYGICKAYIPGVGFKDETAIVDRELAKLRQLDPDLAKELDEYRKTYVKGIIALPSKVDQ